MRDRSYFTPDRLALALALLAALAAAWPAVSQPGLLNTRGGGDSPFLLQRLHQLTVALSDGHFPVRWMPDANYGYGYPFYNYYAPLSIYIAALFRFLGFSFVRAIHLAQLAGFVVAALGMFRLGRRWLGGPWAGFLAAVAYTLAPFHMINIYVRGDSLAEFWAMALYPVVLLAADALLTQPTRRAVAGFAFAYAALILCHNISALIFTPFLLLYVVLRLLGRGREKTPGDAPGQSFRSSLFPLGGALLLAFGLAAWFFVPALAEQDLAQLGPVTEGYFHYSNHFRGADLVQTGIRFDYNPDGGRAFRMGLIQTLLALGGVVCLILYCRPRRGDCPATFDRLAFIGLTTVIATLMISPLSQPLWDRLPLLPYAQFPWRFLSVQALGLALLTGALAWLPRPAVVVSAATGLLLLAALGDLRTDHLILTDADVTAERLAQYEWFTGNIGSTVSAEYLPPAAAPRPYTADWLNRAERDRAVALTGTLDSAVVSRRTTRQTWQFSAGEQGATVQFPTLYWPGWEATIDGAPARLRAEPGSGLMILDVPPGRHQVILNLNRTPLRLASELASLAALLIAGAFLLTDWGQHRPLNRKRGLAVIGLAVLGLLIAAVVVRLRPAQELRHDDLTWDFAQMGYLHHEPVGVGFDNGARLHSYSYSRDDIMAGETLTVTLSLAPGAGRMATLALATPATARPTPDDAAEPPLLVSQTQPLSDEPVVFALPISRHAPAGLYVPRLTIDDARPLTPSGQTRGDLFLRPVRIKPETEGRTINSASPLIPEAEGDFAGDVQALALVERDPLTLDGQFAWFTPKPLDRRYQLSWRVQDGNGAILSRLDTQPGYGFQPATGWRTVEPNYDWLALRLPETLSGPPPYPLVILLYDPVTGEPLLQRRLGEMVAGEDGPVFRSIRPVFTLPEVDSTVNASFSDDDRPLIWLHSYEWGREGNILRLSLYWQVMADMKADYTRFVHLIDPATETIVAQRDSRPVGDSYPTDQWLPGEVVADVVELDLSAVPPGTYRLAVGFYLPEGDLPRLSVADAGGEIPGGRYLLPEPVTHP